MNAVEKLRELWRWRWVSLGTQPIEAEGGNR